ncbi:MAG: guanylate kinase [Dehalococcoidia bacterium]
MGGDRTAPNRSKGAGTTDGSPLLVVLSGPSGVGKDAVLARLQSLEPRLRRVVTLTTRPPRPGEVDGQALRFVSTDHFQGMITEGELLEHARVYGNWYGVPKDQVVDLLRQGFDVILRTDVQGAVTIKGLAPEALLIFIAPASLDELAERRRKRGGVPDADEEVRLKTAPKEMQAAEIFDYVVVNPEGRMDETVARIQAIFEEERRREPPRQVSLG